MKISDKVAIGAFSGIIATSALNIVDWIVVYFGLNKWHIWQIAGSVYFRIEDVDTIPALIIGAITHTSLIAFVGVIICYLLYYTGRDYYMLKGAGVLMLMFILIFGGVLRLHIARINPVDAGTNISHLIGHLSDGVIISWLVVKLASAEAWRKNA